MRLSSPGLFDERNPNSWYFAAFLALFGAFIALFLGVANSEELLLLSLCFALSAAFVSVSNLLRLPSGVLAAWFLVYAALWLSPLVFTEPQMKRIIFGIAVVFVSLSFQGAVWLFFALLVSGLGLLLPVLSAHFDSLSILQILSDQSVRFMHAAIAFGVVCFFLRISRSQTVAIEKTLAVSLESLEQTRSRVGQMLDLIQLTREKFLGRTLAEGEIAFGESLEGATLEPTCSTDASFDELIATLRNTFSEFQIRGRASGRIAGPIRFVFFAPVAGYDEKSKIAVDLNALVIGLEACLNVAFESLPEIGARKREGVIRLSIRYGLRVIEIAIEDNGRGLIARNPEAENTINAFKEATLTWGGTFDRVARLGVGSRTSLELRIADYKRPYRTAISRPLQMVLQDADVPRA